jgi:hypothetical protein
MKRILVLVSLLLIAGLAACSAAPVANEPDSSRVAAIERAATKGGVKVYWINAPQKAGVPGS